MNNRQTPFCKCTYLESLVGLLSTSDILSRIRYSYYRNVVVVSTEEVLSTSYDVAHDNSCTKRVKNVLVVGMKNETFSYSA